MQQTSYPTGEDQIYPVQLRGAESIPAYAATLDLVNCFAVDGESSCWLLEVSTLMEGQSHSEE